MTEEQHAEAILRDIFGNAIVPLTHVQAILTALRAYGDQRAAEMRERAASKVEREWPGPAVGVIRALPLHEPKQAPAQITKGLSDD